ncbi:hypothetical protein FKM82_005238 [Ascaphus truei]
MAQKLKSTLTTICNIYMTTIYQLWLKNAGRPGQESNPEPQKACSPAYIYMMFPKIHTFCMFRINGIILQIERFQVHSIKKVLRRNKRNKSVIENRNHSGFYSLYFPILVFRVNTLVFIC